MIKKIYDARELLHELNLAVDQDDQSGRQKVMVDENGIIFVVVASSVLLSLQEVEYYETL